MKIVAVGDLHGQLGNLFRLLDSEQPDGVLGVGDWGDPGEISSATWQSLLARAPILTVFGNHDDLELLDSLQNTDGSSVLLSSGQQRFFCGLTVAGVSGIWAKSHRQPFYVTDEDVAEFGAALSEEPVDILLTHGCPLGVADRTQSGRPGGNRCFLDLLQTARPQIHLCGHLHVAQRHDIADPPVSALNTGALPRGDYVVLEGHGENLTAQNSRLPDRA